MKYLRIILLSQLLAISVLLLVQNERTIEPEYTTEISQIEQVELPQELVVPKEPEPVQLPTPEPVKPVETKPIVVEIPVVAAPVVETPTKLAENAIESIINDSRQANGLRRLDSNHKLRDSACAKAQHILKYQYWAHVAPDGTTPWFFFVQAGYDYMLAGENLAYGYRNDTETVDAWLNSPAHRENIMNNSFREQGVCSIVGLFIGAKVTMTVQHLGIHQ